MSNSFYLPSTYEELNELYDRLQTNLQQTEKLLTHLTDIKEKNYLPHKTLYIDRMLSEQYEKYEVDSKLFYLLKKQLKLLQS